MQTLRINALAFFWISFLAIATNAVSLDDTTWFVRKGRPLDIVDAENAWRASSDGLKATGEKSILHAGKCVDTGDFEIVAELKLDDVDHDNASFMIDAASTLESSELVFVRRGKVVVRGFFFGDRTQTIRALNGLIRSEEWFHLRVQRKRDTVTFRIAGEPVWVMRYESERPFGKIALKAGKALMTIRAFRVSGKTASLGQWVPRLQRDYPVAGDSSTDVFISGQDGYHTYRIPAIVRANSGALLAFAEGRKDNVYDHGDVDIVLRRGEDRGHIWQPMQLVYEEGGTARITIGNPTPVVDRHTGRVWLFFCRDNKNVLVTYSDDEGCSWATPVDMTATLKAKGWMGWYATGPCHGIQLKTGRLVVPANHGSTKGGRAHMIISDDHGMTWRIGGMPATGTNENSVAELEDGRVYVNMRRSDHTNKKSYCRKVAWSEDGGDTFGPTQLADGLTCSICQASVLTVRHEGQPSLLLQSNPKSVRRERMTVRASLNGGQTWSDGLRIYDGSSAYSDMVQVDNQIIGLLFERDLYGRITFLHFEPKATLAGLDQETSPSARARVECDHKE